MRDVQRSDRRSAGKTKSQKGKKEMAGAARKLNNNLPKRSVSYWRMPYSVLKIRFPKLDKKGNPILTPDGEPVMRNLFFSELKLIGEVYAFSHMKDKPNAVCERSYNDLQERLEIARSTAGRTVKTTKNAGVIKQTKHYHKKAEYTCEGFAETEFYITIEKYLTEWEFYIPRKDCTRRLSDLEVLLISLLGSLCNIPYAQGCERSIQELSDELGYCEDSIREALRNVISAGFLSSSKKVYRAHNIRRLKFNVNPEVRRLMKHTPRKAPEQNGGEEVQTNKPLSPQAEWKRREQERITAADELTERESWYSERQERAIRRAERYIDMARADEAYSAAEAGLRELVFKIPQAELRHSADLEALRATEKRLTLIRAERLAALHISEEDLLPKWYCKKCSDTGFLSDGRMCDCYNPPGWDP